MKFWFWKFLSYPRSIFASLFYPIWFLGISLFALVSSILGASIDYQTRIKAYFGRTSCRMFGVKIRVIGFENCPTGPCLYLFNHTSFFDIFSLFAILPKIYFGAKVELFSIPVFGRTARRFGMVPIPRSQREEAIRNLRTMQDRFQSGDQFALAPEGTRMLTEHLGPFKSGPFILAIESQIPIVPVIIQNAAHILPKGHWFANMGSWNREITIHIEKPIPTRGLTVSNDKERIKDQVRLIMNRYLEVGY